MRCAAIVFLVAGLALAAPAMAEDVTVGYLQLENDPRYDAKRTRARHPLQPLGRPFAGAQVALREVRFHGAAVGATFRLKRAEGAGAQEMIARLNALHGEGVRFFLVDAPADTVASLAAATKGRDLLLFNVTAREDRLRGPACQRHLLHPIPSHAMLTDALAQFLRLRKWTEILLLDGPAPDDKALTRAFERSAKRLGLEIVAKRPFVIGTDPRQRDRNNIRLLTGGDYDAVFVADSDGEFAREVPFRTVRPRPIVGTEGLVPLAWHWAWERHGAPQLEKRFEKRAKREMRGPDWAAWIAVKAVAEAVQRTKSTDFATLRDHLRSQALILDGFKGNRLNFRPWNNQMRQPILLTTHNWVVERAPFDGFLHRLNNLDTLGVDEHESGCRF